MSGGQVSPAPVPSSSQSVQSLGGRGRKGSAPDAESTTSKHKKLQRSRSLPSMRDYEAEILYNRLRGIRGILKYRGGGDDDQSTIATSKSTKNLIGGRKTRTRVSSLPTGSGAQTGLGLDTIGSDVSSEDEDLEAFLENRTIEFQYVEIREYARTVGDNPSCSSGAPISIDWFYDPDVRTLPLDEYENTRPPRRSNYEMIIPRAERHRMLRKEWNVPQSRLAAAIRGSIRIKNQRRVTFSRFGPAEKFEEVIESTKRKLKKMFFGQSVSYKVAELERQYDEIQSIRLQIWEEERSQASGWDSRASSHMHGSRHSAISRDIVDKLKLKPEETNQTNDSEKEEAPKEQRKSVNNVDLKMRSSEKSSESNGLVEKERAGSLPIGPEKDKQPIYNPQNESAEETNGVNEAVKNQQRWEDTKEEFDSRNKLRSSGGSSIAPARSFDNGNRSSKDRWSPDKTHKGSFNAEPVLGETHIPEWDEQVNGSRFKKDDKRNVASEKIPIQTKPELGEKKTTREIEEEKVEISWGEDEKEALGTTSDDRLEL